MPKGSSGRIVIDVDPEFKTEIYAALAAQDCTMKEWFLNHAKRLCEDYQQPTLSLVADPEASYNAPNRSTARNA
ncbi:hypothetical protein [Pelagicoccus albus]|uniref:Uncharacterized protein n=1 Tax=Pelagicoccus albus TaxID=415222 RepID=A0A7X1B896_9BACT|nr:hypothetical protein [Pelagicoccus albus]MBC2607497.1 hypothetical protein [Pelagicoccus albus]